MQYDKAKLQWPQSADSVPTRAVKTNDPFEAANILRKLHGIRVLGSKVTTPLDVRASPLTQALAYRFVDFCHVLPNRLTLPWLQSFSDICSTYKLPKLVQANLSACGFEAPTPVQIQAAPLLLNKRDVIAISPTGGSVCIAITSTMTLSAALARISTKCKCRLWEDSSVLAATGS